MTCVLILDKRHHQQTLLRDALEQSGMRVISAINTQNAFDALRQRHVHLIVCDQDTIQCEDSEFIDKLKQMKDYAQIPLILLASNAKNRKAQSSALTNKDHYLFDSSPHALVGQIRGILRKRIHPPSTGRLSAGSIEMLLDQHRVLIASKEAMLRPMEFRLLEFLMRNPERVHNRTQLLDKVWVQSTFIDERTVDVHIRRLRKVLEEHGVGDMVQTVRGFGYRFSDQPPPKSYRSKC